jgi:beta-glucanase (GH16 family)
MPRSRYGLSDSPCLTLALIFLAAAPTLAAEGAKTMPYDPSAWVDFKPNLPAQAVKRVADAFPLSDQENKGNWARYDVMSDEFDGTTLDPAKWWPINPTWKGRLPGFFSPANLKVSDGQLHLTMRNEEPPEDLKKLGYRTYSCAAVQSKTTVLYGYFEVRAKAMKSAGSSAFWFYNSQPDRWTEIDVLEIGGGAPGFEKKLHMTLHVFHTPTEKKHWSVGGIWMSPTPLADDYHVYGLEWDEKEIQFFFDGVLVRKGPNTHWHQPLTLNFDSETMPDWFGLPKDSDLPSTFSVEYVRAWRKK